MRPEPKPERRKPKLTAAESKTRQIIDWNFYCEVWNERLHASTVSGTPLGEEPFTWMFDHLLDKSKFPQYRYAKWNIILVTLEEHDAKSKGNPRPEHQVLIDKAMWMHESLQKKSPAD